MLKGKLIYIFILFSFLSFGQSKMLLASIQQASGGGSPSTAPSYVGTSTFTESTANNVDINYTTSPTSGNLLLIFIGAGDAAGMDAPSGWTEVGEISNATGDYSFNIFRKYSDGTETGTVNVVKTDTGSTALMMGYMVEFTDVNSTTPIEDVTTTSESVAVFTIPALTSTNDLSLGVCFLGYDDAATETTGPSNWTQIINNQTTTSIDAESFMYTLSIPTATTTSADSQTIATVEDGGTIAFVLIPEF